jgi:molybdopterin-guanine dinucleotide biosynthesis protein A
VVLAGGAGRRFGARHVKASAALGGHTLVARAAATLGQAVAEVVVCARPESILDGLDPAAVVWREAGAGPRHPFSGIAAALRRAGGRAVLVVPVDLPFVTAATLRRVLEAPGELVIVAGQPLVGRYPATAREALVQAAVDGAPARATVAALGAATVDPADDPERELFNVNTVADLAEAEAMLAGGGGGAGRGAG